MARRPATIQDVAKAAKVSTATVSRVLSNPGMVSDAARDAVEDAVRSTGYRPNLAARNLRKGRAGAVLILVPDLGKPFYSGILAGISEGFDGSDYAVLIADTERTPLRPEALAGYFLDGRIDAAISLDGGLPTEALALCRARGLSDRIAFLCEWIADTDLPVVASDNADGARLAMRHLFDLGHRRIAHITGPEGNVLTTARRDGMMAERTRLGLSPQSELIIRGDFSMASGKRAAERIIAMEQRPTAVFCSADVVAFGLMAGLMAGGLSVPGDISVVGFDDIEMSEYYVPALTTVRQDRRRLGLTAAEVILAALAEAMPGPSRRVLVPVTLSVRASTAPPPG